MARASRRTVLAALAAALVGAALGAAGTYIVYGSYVHYKYKSRFIRLLQFTREVSRGQRIEHQRHLRTVRIPESLEHTFRRAVRLGDRPLIEGERLNRHKYEGEFLFYGDVGARPAPVPREGNVQPPP